MNCLVRSLVLALFALALFVPIAAAQNMGSVQGRVTDKETGDAIPFADVILVGTGKGTITKPDGTFLLVQVPEGIYKLRVNRMGFASQVIDQVRVQSGFLNKVNVRLEPVVAREVEVIEVSGEQELVDVEMVGTTRHIDAEEIEAMAVTVLDDVLEKQAGVVKQDGEIYVHGGRAEDTVYRIDGVVIRDLITGKSSAGNISARAVQSVDILTGGFDAEFGQALSGVVDITTKEGASEFGGYAEFQSDHLPLVRAAYDEFNLDNFELQFEGPELISKYALEPLGVDLPGKLSYFLSLSGEYDNTYLPRLASDGSDNTLHSSYVDNFLGIDIDYGDDFWTPRAQNRWQALYKTSWQPNGKNKINLSFSKRLTIDHGFFRRQLTSTADPGTNSTYSWAWSRRTDHDYTITDDNNTITLDWRKVWNKNFSSTTRLSRNFMAFFQNVGGRPWYTYESPDETDLPRDEDIPFFWQTGDNAIWHNRYTEAWVGYFDATWKKGDHHEFKGGTEVSYEDLQFVTISEPWVADPDGLGKNHDLWRVNPTTGAIYLRDKFNFEGFIGNVGLRYDYWFPGRQAERALADTSREASNESLHDEFLSETNVFLGRRFKGELLPRFAVSHPVTDRSHMYFNYGHFAQRPNYYYVYSKISSVSSEDFPLIGNLNLDSKRTVKYELGARHQFSDDLALDLSVFNDDIFDYPKSIRFDRRGRPSFFIYINEDFARARGIEVELRKKRSDYLWARASYSFSTVTGKASDPNQLNLLQEEVGSFPQVGRDEEKLSWNRPHKFTLDLTFSVGKKQKPPTLWGYTFPQDWSLNTYMWFQSGRAYTPENAAGEETAQRSSKNAPFETTFDLRFRKGLRFAGTKLNYLVEVRNLFNHQYPRRIDAQTGKGYVIGEGSLDRELTEYEINQWSDPSIKSRPRSIRMGLSSEF